MESLHQNRVVMERETCKKKVMSDGTHACRTESKMLLFWQLAQIINFLPLVERLWWVLMLLIIEKSSPLFINFLSWKHWRKFRPTCQIFRPTCQTENMSTLIFPYLMEVYCQINYLCLNYTEVIDTWQGKKNKIISIFLWTKLLGKFVHVGRKNLEFIFLKLQEINISSYLAPNLLIKWFIEMFYTF